MLDEAGDVQRSARSQTPPSPCGQTRGSDERKHSSRRHRCRRASGVSYMFCCGLRFRAHDKLAKSAEVALCPTNEAVVR